MIDLLLPTINSLLADPSFSILALCSFLTFFAIRILLIKRIIFILLYHVCLFCILFIFFISGVLALGDDYRRLDKFILLEKNHQLEEARNKLEDYDSMFQIDLKQFKNSDEFKMYINDLVSEVNIAFMISIGWILVLFADSLIICVLIYNKLKN